MIRNLKLVYVALMICMTVFAATADAEIYKWIDANGKVHYSDMKTNSNAKQLDVTTGQSTIGVQNSDVNQRMANQSKYLNYLQSERLEREEKRELQKEQQAKKNQYCAALKDQLRNFTEERARWYELDNSSGQRRYISDSELEQRKYELQKEIKSNCS